MESIWMGIAPGKATTRIVALESPSDTILKAQLRKDPAHPRALATLLEAIALWQGQPVRAALCAEGSGLSCDSTRKAWGKTKPRHLNRHPDRRTARRRLRRARAVQISTETEARQQWIAE